MIIFKWILLKNKYHDGFLRIFYGFKHQIYARPVYKIMLALTIALFYFIKCFQYSEAWIFDVSNVYNYYIALLIIMGIALIPGFINAFVLVCVMLDKRPSNKYIDEDLPPITILIAAYNEVDKIQDTLLSINNQTYQNFIQCIVVDDGSTDGTVDKIKEFIKINSIKSNIKITPVFLKENKGKAHALNSGLLLSEFQHILTVDGDSWLYKDALSILVSDYLKSPPNTVACAGTILVKNSRNSWITKFQEQDYFFAISSIKRTQHLSRGVLVAQGALSIYRKWVIEECGGWQPLVGEDIILSWNILNKGYYISHSERAICWTNAPETYAQYFQQRRRWARGMVEAFKNTPSILSSFEPYTIFVVFNLFFPFLDFCYLFVFAPSVLLALALEHYLIVSKITLLLIPMGIAMNITILMVQLKTFKFHGLKIRKHYGWMLFYFLIGNIISSPASLRGYFDEFLNVKKSWGTK